jgi:MOSC domain-containing protein YiiM
LPVPWIVSINISPGGVPKHPIDAAAVTALGLEGDGQRDTVHHGGPDRALCLFSMELIAALQREGHPIAPGSTGENLTIEGLDWPALGPGGRIRFAGGVEIELTNFTTPCSNIRGSFVQGSINRIKQALNPGWSRIYARVLIPGRLTRGEELLVIAPAAATPATTPR